MFQVLYYYTNCIQGRIFQEETKKKKNIYIFELKRIILPLCEMYGHKLLLLLQKY